jgi:hypothetical protein
MGQSHLFLRRTKIESLAAQHTGAADMIDLLVRRFGKHRKNCTGQGLAVLRQGAGVILDEELLVPAALRMDVCVQAGT